MIISALIFDMIRRCLGDHIELHQSRPIARSPFDLRQIAALRLGISCHKSKFNLEPAEAPMRAHQIMTRPVITVTPETTIVEAANTMLHRHVSGLPVVDAAGKLSASFRRAISFAVAKSAPSASAGVSEIHSRPGQGGSRFRSRARRQGRRDHDARPADDQRRYGPRGDRAS